MSWVDRDAPRGTQIIVLNPNCVPFSPIVGSEEFISDPVDEEVENLFGGTD